MNLEPQIKEESMKAYRWFTPVIVLAVMVFWMSSVQGEDNGINDKRAAYEKMLTNYAAKCVKQARFGESKSKNLRRRAEIACLKAAYLNQYKSQIIDDLINKNVEPKPYKIHYAVNTLFYDLIRRTAQPHSMPTGLIAAE